MYYHLFIWRQDISWKQEEETFQIEYVEWEFGIVNSDRLKNILDYRLLKNPNLMIVSLF